MAGRVPTPKLKASDIGVDDGTAGGAQVIAGGSGPPIVGSSDLLVGVAGDGRSRKWSRECAEKREGVRRETTTPSTPHFNRHSVHMVSGALQAARGSGEREERVAVKTSARSGRTGKGRDGSNRWRNRNTRVRRCLKRIQHSKIPMPHVPQTSYVDDWSDPRGSFPDARTHHFQTPG